MTKHKGHIKVLSEIDHTLLRPGIMLGSLVNTEREVNIPVNIEPLQLEKKTTKLSQGFLKLFDEIIENAVDEYTRHPSKNYKIHVDLKYITNFADEDTEDELELIFSVSDTGRGIPIQKDKATGKYQAELAFSQLRAGSNFDDEDDLERIGMNGVGSSVVNVFSNWFDVHSGDNKGKVFTGNWQNNSRKSKIKIIKKEFKGTTVAFSPELSRFDLDLTKIRDDILPQLILKRLLELKLAIPAIKFYLTTPDFEIDLIKPLKINDLFPDGNDSFTFNKNKFLVIDSEIADDWILLNGLSVEQKGYVDNPVRDNLYTRLKDKIKRKYKILISKRDFNNNLSFVLNVSGTKLAFDSQVKTRVVAGEYGLAGILTLITDGRIRAMLELTPVLRMVEIARRRELAKNQADAKKNQRRAKSKNVESLTDATSKIVSERSLILTEGDSAALSMISYRVPKHQGFYPLRGVFINVYNDDVTKIIKNKIVQNLCNILNLDIFNPDISKCSYQYIILAADADPDGAHIVTLLYNFFYKFWPKLVEEGRVLKMLSPLFIAKKGKEVHRFYTQNDIDKFSFDIKDYKVSYYKGLGSLSDTEFAFMMEHPRLIQPIADDNSGEIFDDLFNKDNVQTRKKMIFEE